MKSFITVVLLCNLNERWQGELFDDGKLKIQILLVLAGFRAGPGLDILDSRLDTMGARDLQLRNAREARRQEIIKKAER